MTENGVAENERIIGRLEGLALEAERKAREYGKMSLVAVGLAEGYRDAIALMRGEEIEEADDE